MNVVLITGLSGAGKTHALRAMEDIGYYCVDNIPPRLLPQLITLTRDNTETDLLAIGVDARGGSFFHEIEAELSVLDGMGQKYDIIFLDARDMVLMGRYKETRRHHPLEKKMPLKDSIAAEREMLDPIYKRATFIIDTSEMKPKELWRTITSIYREADVSEKTQLLIMSFGFKYGVPQVCDLVFDVRFLPNPFYLPELRPLSGLDDKVSNFVMSFDETGIFIDKLMDMLNFLLPNYIREGNKYPTIGIGCTGGHHRSVAIAQRLGQLLNNAGYNVDIDHFDINKDGH